jgi:hypothetical protein
MGELPISNFDFRFSTFRRALESEPGGRTEAA